MTEFFVQYIKFEPIVAWLSVHGLRIILILFGSWLFLRIIKTILSNRILKDHLLKRVKKEKFQKRAETINTALLSTAKFIVYIFAFLMILSEFGVNIGPLIAGAGIAGLAIGFGAKNLVADFISGFFILLEGQYEKGDIVEINGIKGEVLDFSLRKTVLKAKGEVELHIPNGQIKTVANYMGMPDKIDIPVSVAYETDLDKAYKVLNKIGQDLAKHKEFGEFVVEPPQVLGVDKFGESEIVIKYFGKCRPGKQWGICRHLRKVIKEAFEKEGIEIPYPHRVIIKK